MNYASDLRSLLNRDCRRLHVLDLVRSLGLPDCWVAAGFVRSAVWDHLHELPVSMPDADVDVVWFDALRAMDEDRMLEQRLLDVAPGIRWSVKNQSRMHVRNDDRPYSSVADAIRYWPETATAVAVRRTDGGTLEVAAPFGLDDLFGLIVRPTPRFAGAKHDVFLSRMRDRQWLCRWPRLSIAEIATAPD